MLRLLLLRHAKSDWSTGGRGDFDRPLSERGRVAAARMGAHIASRKLVPAAILCSPALRARETLALLLPYFSREMDVKLIQDLYDSSEGDYCRLINELGHGDGPLMVIGHNPAIQETAIALTGEGNLELAEEINLKYPTGALAVIDFDAAKWLDIARSSGRLAAFFRPKTLPAG